MGSTGVNEVKIDYKPEKFFRMTVYPNNSFFANSNTRGITHPIEDFTKSVWAFPVNGYLGDKGYLFDSG